MSSVKRRRYIKFCLNPLTTHRLHLFKTGPSSSSAASAETLREVVIFWRVLAVGIVNDHASDTNKVQIAARDPAEIFIFKNVLFFGNLELDDLGFKEPGLCGWMYFQSSTVAFVF